jgi:hypothetical protein
MQFIISHFGWILFVVFIAWILFLLNYIIHIMLNLKKSLSDFKSLPHSTPGKIKKEDVDPYIERVTDQIKSSNRGLVRTINEISEQTEKVGAQLAALAKKIPEIADIKVKETPDYKARLETYLNMNFVEHCSVIMQIILSLKDNINDSILLKDQIINLAINTGFGSMSETKKMDFCDIVNDYLSQQVIQLFVPREGIDFEERTMSLKKQLSASKKVSKVLYFGMMQNQNCILKADVNVG